MEPIVSIQIGVGFLCFFILVIICLLIAILEILNRRK